ncbi:MAG TPA: glutathione binding-like protein, partial [Rhodopila sp.]
PAGDIEAEAQIVSWMSFTASTLHPARQRGGEHALRVWQFAEQKLGKNTWAVGAYSIADIHLFRLFWRSRGAIGADPATFPNLCGHYDRMMQRQAVYKTIADEVALGYSLPM